MSFSITSVAAIILYLTATLRMAAVIGREPDARVRRQALSLGVLALALHAVGLYRGVVTELGLNLSILNAASLVAWLAVLVVLIAAVKKPVENLTVVVLPIAALALGLDLAIPGHRILPSGAPLGLEVHIVLSIIAYSILSIAALQALMVAFAERRLRQKRPALVLQWLPPLHTMEASLFQFIAVGLFFLSLGLLAGFMFVDDLLAQHLVHKTVLSLTAWLIFAVLLWGRYHFGWRGRIAVRYTLAGIIVLALAFFGSKLVLEVILKRV